MVIDLELHRPVWVTAKVACRKCPGRCVSSVHIDADWDRLECPLCRERTAAVTHVDIDPDGPEYAWSPRMQVAREAR